jgi:hypothetical protein
MLPTLSDQTVEVHDFESEDGGEHKDQCQEGAAFDQQKDRQRRLCGGAHDGGERQWGSPATSRMNRP